MENKQSILEYAEMGSNLNFIQATICQNKKEIEVLSQLLEKANQRITILERVLEDIN